MSSCHRDPSVALLNLDELLFQSCRCRHLADPVVHKTTPVTICVFCKMSKAVFHPRGYHWNENMCVVCGGMLGHGPHFTFPAYLCVFHTPFGGVGPPVCFLCGSRVHAENFISGRLCQHCGFGNYGKQCVAMDIRKH